MGNPVNFYSRPDASPINFYGRPAVSTQLEYLGLEASQIGGSDTSNNASQLSSALTIKRMVVERAVAPGSNNSITWTLVQNGSDTAMKLSLEDAGTLKYIDTDIPVSQNDQLYTKVEYVGSVSYDTTTFYNISYLIDGGGVQNFFERNREQNLSVDAIEVPIKGGWTNGNVGANRFPLIFPTNGTIKDFSLTSSAPIFSVNSSGTCEYKLDLKLYGGGTSKLLLINDTVGTSYSSTINKVVSKNDAYTIERSGNFTVPELNTATFLNYGMTFEAATLGDYIYGITFEEDPDDGPFFYPASGVLQAATTFERHTTIPFAGTIKNFMGLLSTVAGDQGPITVTLRKNSVDTALSFSFTSNTTIAESIADVSVVFGDKLSIKLSSAGSTFGSVRGVSWTFASSIVNYYPVFWSDQCTGSLPTATDIIKPINFYSLP